jgi:hypothetical protein
MKTFYDPHPGRAGASIALPEIVLLVARGLDGKEMEVPDAVRIIQDAANDLVADGTFGDAKVEDHKEYIGLMLTEGEGGAEDFPKHSFRVIRYK